jgi:hypothetical protein
MASAKKWLKSDIKLYLLTTRLGQIDADNGALKGMTAAKPVPSTNKAVNK